MHTQPEGRENIRCTFTFHSAFPRIVFILDIIYENQGWAEAAMKTHNSGHEATATPFMQVCPLIQSDMVTFHRKQPWSNFSLRNFILLVLYLKI